MNWWPFPTLRNEETDPALTEVFNAFSGSEQMKVMSCDGYTTVVTSEKGRLEFWSANKYCAYAKEGVYRSADGVSSPGIAGCRAGLLFGGWRKLLERRSPVSMLLRSRRPRHRLMKTYGCTLCGSSDHNRSGCPMGSGIFTRLIR